MSSPRRTFLAPGNRGPEEVSDRLTSLLENLASRSRLHHASMAITSVDGERYWSGACGPEGSDEPEVRTESPFFIASITKRFIVTLILQAHERGELALDSPISRYLPSSITTGLHVRGGVDRTPSITVRHLASHTSGLPDFFERRRGGPSLYKQLRAGTDIAWDFDEVVRITREEQRAHFDPQDLSAPRQRARYSDTGFQLLIQVLQQATGRSFAELLAERITEPLSLTQTWHPESGPATSTRALPLPLHARRRPVSVPQTIRSSNDLYSTTDDLITFERALLVGSPFTRPTTRRLLVERRNRLANAPVIRYGLGTMIFRVNRIMSPTGSPVHLVGHSGSTGTWLFTCPELGVHMAGTVDQTEAQSLPFSVMAKGLRIWAH